MIQSMFSKKSIEEVTEACNGKGLRWMQVQPIRDQHELTDILQRAERLDYKAVVVTCDQPRMPNHYCNRKKPTRNYQLGIKYLGNFSLKLNESVFCTEERFLEAYEDAFFQPGATWEYLDWIRSITSLPIVAKGILNPEDAKEALQHGVQAILVSNHGGRVLDGVPATVRNIIIN